ncbi:MAG TPA: hypothetical protein VMU67_07955 [Steroidobacteraceae bacterium]|nr:hypothetical protein [Steroidobacteraceae bacterium]
MSRLRVALVLPFLLVLVQQGAVLHELSHTYYSARPLGAQLSDDPQLLDESRCPACQAFAQVAHPAQASLAPLALPPATAIRAPEPVRVRGGADAPQPRSRDPPLLRV